MLLVRISSSTDCIFDAFEKLRDEVDETDPDVSFTGRSAAKIFQTRYDCIVDYGDGDAAGDLVRGVIPDVLFTEKAWTAFAIQFPPGPTDFVTTIEVDDEIHR